MGWFKNREKKVYPKQTYKIFMTQSGKVTDPVIEAPVVTEESELLAIWAAEKMFPRLKVAKTERIE